MGGKNAKIKTLKLSDSTNNISLELLEVFSVDGPASKLKLIKFMILVLHILL